MAKRSFKKASPWYVPVLLAFTIFSLALALLMMIPLWVALSVGLAALSIVLFSLSTIGALLLFFLDKRRSTRIVAVIGIVVGLFSLVVPQVGMIRTAVTHNAHLTFDPVSYLTFSGETTKEPSVVKTYKTVGEQKLQLAYYKPLNVENPPLVVLLHGGAWRYGDHLETGMWPEFLTKAGFAVVSVQYRLSNESYHSWEDTPADIHDAMNHLKSNVDLYSFDQNKIHLMGHSAGGHLALLEAYRFGSVESVIALYAPIDLKLDYETSKDKSAELDFFGGPPKQFPERYEALSPISYIDSNDPRTLIVQGLYDDLVSPRQATQLQNVLNSYGVGNETVLLPMTGHSFENQRGGFATQITRQKVLQFLKY